MNLKNLFTRAIAGAVYIAIVLFGILGGKYLFISIFGIFLIIGLLEYYKMIEKIISQSISKILNIFFGIVIFLSVFLYLENINSIALPVAIATYLLIQIISAIFINRKNILHAIVYSSFGQLYITMPLSILMIIINRFGFNEVNGNILALAAFVFIWINDTAAYLVGSLMGKHKLIERISPKKTIEGFVGGIIISSSSAFIFAHLFPIYTLLFWIGFALITGLSGTVGDLFESLIKRTCGFKDSGTLIPGHGGILDRIDSLLIVIPTIYVYLMLVL